MFQTTLKTGRVKGQGKQDHSPGRPGRRHRLRLFLVAGALCALAGPARAQSNCCVDQGPGNAGCDTPSCQACVCAIDPLCCDAGSFYWDVYCAQRAANPAECAAVCSCGTCGDGVINLGEACDEGAANQPGVSCCSASCQILSSGEVCRPLVPDPTADASCDVVETCTAGGVCVGGSNHGAPCTGPLDCDTAGGGKCTAACPADTVQAAATPCRAAAGVCDVAEACNGSSPFCPGDAKSTAVCRPAAGPCDVAESCDGVGNACPADAKSTAVCRPPAGPCDVGESCDGVADTCPPDGFAPPSVVCRPLGGGGAAVDCDVVESCTGSGPACPADAWVADGTICAGTDPNACKNACVTGACVAGTPVTASACCGNGLLDPGEQCDDGNQVSGDACPSLPGDDCQFGGGPGLVRGSQRNPATDRKSCQVEWAVTGAGARLDRYGLPSSEQRCRDQDPTCDFDPTPGRCRFQVAVCLNNTDPNLPACVPAGISTVELLPYPRRFDRHPRLAAQAASNAAQVQTALVSLLDPANPGAGYTNAPPLAPGNTNFCSQTMLLEAFSSDFGSFDHRTAAMVFQTRSADASTPLPLKDSSQLRLVCEPRPLK